MKTPVTPLRVRCAWPTPWASSCCGCLNAAPTLTPSNTSGGRRKASSAPITRMLAWTIRWAPLSTTSKTFLPSSASGRRVYSPKSFGSDAYDINFVGSLSDVGPGLLDGATGAGGPGCPAHAGGAGRRPSKKKRSNRGGALGGPELIPLSVPEVRRLLWWLVWGRRARRAEPILSWSRWRRRHQAVARRSHHRRQRKRRGPTQSYLQL